MTRSISTWVRFFDILLARPQGRHFSMKDENIHLQDFDVTLTTRVSQFFRNIFTEMGWEIWESDLIDDPINAFQLPDWGALIVCQQETRIIGTGGFVALNSTESVLKRFYVDPTFRGQGISQMLLEALLKKAAAKKVTKLVLDVNTTNSRAIRFYEKSGFRRFSPSPLPNWNESQAPDKFTYFYIPILDAYPQS